MSINILPGTRETLDAMKGQKFVPHTNEGVVYIKLMMIKPETMEEGDPAQMVEVAPGAILCGNLDEIKDQISEWFAQSAAEYRTVSGEVDPELQDQKEEE